MPPLATDFIVFDHRVEGEKSTTRVPSSSRTATTAFTDWVKSRRRIALSFCATTWRNVRVAYTPIRPVATFFKSAEDAAELKQAMRKTAEALAAQLP
jgi:hypothetical protein